MPGQILDRGNSVTQSRIQAANRPFAVYVGVFVITWAVYVLLFTGTFRPLARTASPMPRQTLPSA